MLKIRITYVTDTQEQQIEDIKKTLEQDGYMILNQSKPYKGRGDSKYSNVYLDVEK